MPIKERIQKRKVSTYDVVNTKQTKATVNEYKRAKKVKNLGEMFKLFPEMGTVYIRKQFLMDWVFPYQNILFHFQEFPVMVYPSEATSLLDETRVRVAGLQIQFAVNERHKSQWPRITLTGNRKHWAIRLYNFAEKVRNNGFTPKTDN